MMRIVGASAACAMLAACGGGGERPAASAPVLAQSDWHSAATSADRARLRGWRTAWMQGLAQARSGGATKDVAALGALLDPDRAVAGPALPDGDYRCRTVKLGSKNGRDGFVLYPWFTCRVSGSTLTKLDGSQRMTGTIRPDTDARDIFLGALALGDETRSMAYARDASRDMAGVVERIGEKRWRIAFPYPRFESTIDVLELVPR